MDVRKAQGGRYQCTYGLLADVVKCVRCCVNDLTLDLVGPTSVVPQAASGGGNIDVLGHGEGLAVVESLDGSEKIGVLEEKVGKLDQKLSAVLGCLLPPWAVECLAGSLDSDVDIFLGRLLDGCDDLFCGGVDDLKCLAIDRLDELVVDEAVLHVSSCGKQWSFRRPVADSVDLQTSGLVVLARLGSLELH